MLEIGVHKAGLSKVFFRDFGDRISSYVGVDPYLGTKNDQYFIGYWKGDAKNADSAYEEVKIIYQSSNVNCERLRQTSDDFFASNKKKFDVVIIDGDHRRPQVDKDLRNGIDAMAPGGIMFCDDYANPEHPEVAPACIDFDREFDNRIEARNVHFVFFNRPPSRKLAYPLGVAFWKLKPHP